ncbi:MAG: RNA-binding protein [Candidatus Dojkabacteria bacterium]|nr:MAG: RNA-binding protein [Candidatus Dojkabacteria bacterium]
MDNNKIFIGNVAYATAMETLLEVFSKYGQIVESYKPEGKGFAFITFDSPEAAQKAIEEMNGQEVDGRALVVNIARPREERPRNSYGNRGGYGGGRDNNRY